MAHLNVEEIIEFVSFEDLSKDSMELSIKVNGHIRSCPECLKKVSAFQTVYDELRRIVPTSTAKKSLYHLLDEKTLEMVQNDKVRKEIQTLAEGQLNDLLR